MTYAKALIAFFALLIFNSCSKQDLALFMPSTYFPKETLGEEVVFLPNTDPQNVLENLKTCYNHRNYPNYDSLLAPDYRFYMSATYQGAFGGAADAAPDPSRWTLEIVDSAGHPVKRYYKDRNQDLEAVRILFDPSKDVKDIDLYFQASLPSSSNDTAVFRITNIELKVTQRSTGIVYTATDQGNASVTEATLVQGADGRWRISRWIDGTEGAGDDQ
jgi:hypothetical protein